MTWDASKRLKTLKERGLDFQDAETVFDGPTLTLVDDRQDYGESRFQTYGFLAGRLIAIVWTPRENSRRVISMRHCHEREARKVVPRMDRSG